MHFSEILTKSLTVYIYVHIFFVYSEIYIFFLEKMHWEVHYVWCMCMLSPARSWNVIRSIVDARSTTNYALANDRQMKIELTAVSVRDRRGRNVACRGRIKGRPIPSTLSCRPILTRPNLSFFSDRVIPVGCQHDQFFASHQQTDG